MTYTALVKFTGVVGGVETVFNPGDVIADAPALEMALASKPELAEETGA